MRIGGESAATEDLRNRVETILNSALEEIDISDIMSSDSRTELIVDALEEKIKVISEEALEHADACINTSFNGIKYVDWIYNTPVGEGTDFSNSYIDEEGNKISSNGYLTSPLITSTVTDGYNMIMLTPPNGKGAWITIYENDTISSANFVAQYGDYENRRTNTIVCEIKPNQSFVVSLGVFSNPSGLAPYGSNEDVEIARQITCKLLKTASDGYTEEISNYSNFTSTISGTYVQLNYLYDDELDALKLYGTAPDDVYILCLNGQNSRVSTSTAFNKTFDAGTYTFEVNVSGYSGTRPIRWAYTYGTFSSGVTMLEGNEEKVTVTFDRDAMVGLALAKYSNFGTESEPTSISISISKITTIDSIARAYVEESRDICAEYAEDAAAQAVKDSIPADYSALSNDVGNLKGEVSIQDNRTNQLLGYLNYGYDTPYDLPIGTGASKAVAVKRSMTEVVLNSNDAITVGPVICKLNNDVQRASTNAQISAFTNGTVFESGHTYRITERKISGTYSYTEAEPIPGVVVYKVGENNTVGTAITRTENEMCREFTADGSEYMIALRCQKNSVISNFKAEITMRDVADESVFERIDALDNEISDVDNALTNQLMTALTDNTNAGYYLLPKSAYAVGWIDSNGNYSSTITYRICTPDIQIALTNLILRPREGHRLTVRLFDDTGTTVTGTISPSNLSPIRLQSGQKYKFHIRKVGETSESPAVTVDEMYDKAMFFNPVQQIEPIAVYGDAEYTQADYGLVPSGVFYPGIVNESYNAFSFDTTTAEIYAAFDALVSANGAYITKTDLGLCSDNVQHVYMYDFKPNQRSSGTIYDEIPVLFLLCGQHGYEKASVFSTYYLFKHMIENTGENPILNYLRNHFRIICIPVANPYGFDQKQYKNYNGVNLNRNWDTEGWGEGEGEQDPSSKDYAGTVPFSEPETQAVRDAFLQYKDSICIAIDYHTYGSVQPVNMESINEIVFPDNMQPIWLRFRKGVRYHIKDITSHFSEQYNLNLPDNEYCGSTITGENHGAWRGFGSRIITNYPVPLKRFRASRMKQAQAPIRQM